MPEREILISKKSVKTMGKDIVGLKRGDVGDNKKSKKDDKNALEQEIERRKQEEERLKGLQEQGKQIAEEAKKEEERRKGEEERRKQAETKRIAEEKAAIEEKRKKEEEAKKLMVLQEARRKAAEEEMRATQEKAKRIAEEEMKAKEEQERKRIAEEKAREEEAREQMVLQEAERKKQEEAKRIAEEKREKESFLEERRKLQEKKRKDKEELSVLVKDKDLLDQKRTQLLKEIGKIEIDFNRIENQEKQIEEKQRIIEEKEVKAESASARRKIERKRWGIEKRREQLEKTRWPLDKKLEKLELELEGLEKSIKKIERKEKELESKEKEVDERIETIEMQIEAIDLKDSFKEVEEIKIALKQRSDILFRKLEDAKQNFATVLNQEKQIEEQKRSIEEGERTAENSAKRRELEKQRWQVEEKRRKIESQRWGAEEIKDKAEEELKLTQDKFKSILNKKENMDKRLNQIDQILRGEAPKPEPQPTTPRPEFQPTTPRPELQPTTPKPEPQPVAPVPEPAVPEPETIPPKPGPQPEPKPPKDFKEESTEEKLEVIEKERRDRLEEARKRIEVLKKSARERKIRQEEMKTAPLPSQAKQKLVPRHSEPEPIEEEKRKEIFKRLRTPTSIYNKIKENVKDYKEKESKEKVVPKKLGSKEIIRVVPKKPSFREKLWVRALIVAATLVILAGILTFWYWYFKIRISAPVYPPGYEREREGIQIPSSLFNVSDTVIITITEDEELGSAIEKVLAEEQKEGQFRRLVIKKAGEVVNLKKFFEILSVDVLDNLFDNIIDEPTMFIYGQPQGNRFGFVVKTSTTKRDLTVVLKSMEPTMETDFESLFALMGKEGKGIAPFFKSSSSVVDYIGPEFRFKTLNQNDLGIVYSTSDYYFVLSSSWKSMEDVLEKLDESLMSKALIKDLKIGDEGEQVKLLQKWLARDLEDYDSSLATGSFNQTTKNATISFQEKYAEDILIPQGLPGGTGIIDLLTRKKLNELYSEF